MAYLSSNDCEQQIQSHILYVEFQF